MSAPRRRRRADDIVGRWDGVERSEAIFRWMVRHMFSQVEHRPSRALMEALGMPPKVREQRRRWGDWLVRRTEDPRCRQILMSMLVESARVFSEPLLFERDAAAGARHLERFVRQVGAPGIVLQAEWTMGVWGRGGQMGEVVRMLPEDLRDQSEHLASCIVRDEEEAEARLRGLEVVSARARATALAGVDRAERRAVTARSEAARQMDRAVRARRVAADKVARAENRCRELERRVRELTELLAERDLLVADLVRGRRARGEARAAGPGGVVGAQGPARGEAPDEGPLALRGLRVLVLGDAPRAGAYCAWAEAQGARRVDFVEGMDLAAGALEGLVPGADMIVVVVGHARHAAVDIVRRHARADARVVLVRRVGLAAFRMAVLGSVRAAALVGTGAAGAGREAAAAAVVAAPAHLVGAGVPR